MPREAFRQSIDFPLFALVRYPFWRHAFSGELRGSIALKSWIGEEQDARRLSDRRLYHRLQEASGHELRRPGARGLYGHAVRRRHEEWRRHRTRMAGQLRHGLPGPELDPRPGAVPAAG